MDDTLLGLSVEEAIQQHCKDMLKCSLRVNTLCEVLNCRDIATSDTYEKILSKVLLIRGDYLIYLGNIGVK